MLDQNLLPPILLPRIFRRLAYLTFSLTPHRHRLNDAGTCAYSVNNGTAWRGIVHRDKITTPDVRLLLAHTW